jgi:hypothetical protein
MLVACARKWPYDIVEDDNEADARWIAETAFLHLGGKAKC